MPPEVFIPTEWTPLAALRATMRRAMAADDYRNPYDPEFHEWWLGYLVFWKQDRVELAGRLGSPRAERLLISYPVAERDREKFAFYQFADARLFHHASNEMFYDVHIRLMAAALTSEPATRSVSVSVPEQRDALVHDAWGRAGFPPDWSAKVAFQAARELCNDPLLMVGDRAERQCWQRVKARRGGGTA